MLKLTLPLNMLLCRPMLLWPTCWLYLPSSLPQPWEWAKDKQKFIANERLQNIYLYWLIHRLGPDKRNTILRQSGCFDSKICQLSRSLVHLFWPRFVTVVPLFCKSGCKCFCAYCRKLKTIWESFCFNQDSIETIFQRKVYRRDVQLQKNLCCW